MQITLQQKTQHPTNLFERCVKGVLKIGTPLWRRRLNAWSTSLLSDAGSIFQKLPFPGSSWDRGTLTKYLFSDRLCRMEFWQERWVEKRLVMKLMWLDAPLLKILISKFQISFLWEHFFGNLSDFSFI